MQQAFAFWSQHRGFDGLDMCSQAALLEKKSKVLTWVAILFGFEIHKRFCLPEKSKVKKNCPLCCFTKTCQKYIFSNWTSASWNGYRRETFPEF
jgi:hypothetical protein